VWSASSGRRAPASAKRVTAKKAFMRVVPYRRSRPALCWYEHDSAVDVSKPVPRMVEVAMRRTRWK
jgi:hypothetical protein